MAHLSVSVQQGPSMAHPSVSTLDKSRALQDEALASLGLFRYKVPEDGNCMFRAVAAQLRLDQEKYHSILREAAVTWMGQHVNELLAGGLLDGLAEMHDTAKEGVWPGQAALVALANVLHVNIAIVQGGDQGSVDIQHVTPFEGVSTSDHSGVILAYLYNGHYDAVVHEPNVPNPDYALWAAERHYNDAVSEVVARKLSEESGLPAGIYSILHSDTEKSISSDWSDRSVSSPAPGERVSSRMSLHSPMEPDHAKVSSLQIDLKPMCPQQKSPVHNPQTSVLNMPSAGARDQRNGDITFQDPYIHSDRGLDQRGIKERRRPSVDNVKGQTVSEARHSVLRPSKSAVSVEQVEQQQQDSLIHPIPRRSRSVARPSQEVLYNGPRRSSSPGAPTKKQSPYHYIAAAVEKERRRSSSGRKLSQGNVALPYTYDGSVRVYGAGPESREASRERPQTTRQYSAPMDYEYSAKRRDSEKENSQKKVYSQDNLKVTDRKSSWPSSSPSTQKKKFGADLKSRRTGKPAEGEDAGPTYAATYNKLKPMKQNSLSKDFGRDEQAEQGLKSLKERRSSEGAKNTKSKESGKVTRPSFGLDFTSKSIKKESLKKEPPKVLPKPYVQIVNEQELQSMLPVSISSQITGASQVTMPRERRSSEEKKVIIIPIKVASNNATEGSRKDSRTRSRPPREGDTFAGFHKTRVRSRERRRSRDHTGDGTQPMIRVRKPSNTSTDTGFDTVTVVTTPTDTENLASNQRMPYVGLSPSETRKVNVQVSTDDYEANKRGVAVKEPVQLQSPQLVRNATALSSSNGVGGSTHSLYQAPRPSTSAGAGGSTHSLHQAPRPSTSAGAGGSTHSLHQAPRPSTSAQASAHPSLSTAQASAQASGQKSAHPSAHPPAHAALSTEPGIRRVLYAQHDDRGAVEIPLRSGSSSQQPAIVNRSGSSGSSGSSSHQPAIVKRSSPSSQQPAIVQQQEQVQLPRRRSVVEIHPQPLQTQIVPPAEKKSVIQIPITHIKSSDSKNIEIQQEQRKHVDVVTSEDIPGASNVSDFLKSFRSPQKVDEFDIDSLLQKNLFL